MQRIELNALRIVDRRSADFSQRRPRSIHARNNTELRNQCEREHSAQQHVSRRKHMRGAIGKAAVEQGADQIDDSGNKAIQCSLPKARPTTLPARWVVGQNRECRRRQHECKKDQPADPQDERKQHEKTKERHSVSIVVVKSGEAARFRPTGTDHRHRNTAGLARAS